MNSFGAMNAPQSILHLIQSVQESEKRLTPKETVTILEELQHLGVDTILLQKVIDTLLLVKNNEDKIGNLSPRESQIFKLIGLNHSSRDIGLLLGISEATVSTHRKKIIKKLDLSGMGQLARLAHHYILIQVYF